MCPNDDSENWDGPSLDLRQAHMWPLWVLDVRMQRQGRGDH